MGSDPEDQLRAGELLWVLAREGIHLQGVPFVVVIEIGNLLADGIAKGLATQTIADADRPTPGRRLQARAADRPHRAGSCHERG